MRSGIGYDIHKLVKDRALILGGVEIPFEKGLLGHSDADVLLHAISDALLGGAALGDIGEHFPDTDPAYEGVSSLELLEEVNSIIASRGFSVINIDATIIIEEPKMAPYIIRMRENIAVSLGISSDQISIKATTHEQLGEIGKGKAVAALAIAQLQN